MPKKEAPSDRLTVLFIKTHENLILFRKPEKINVQICFFITT
jgi:hypothetical protein